MTSKLRTLESLLWLICVASAAFFALDRHSAFAAAQQRVSEFASRAPTDTPTPVRAPDPDMTTWSQERIEAFARFSEPSLTEALLRIPKLSLAAPIMSGVDQVTLDRAIGRVPWTALPGETGNLVLAGHRDSFLRELDALEIGDQIIVDGGETQWTYIVESHDIVKPDNIDVMADTDVSTLTLITCYPFYFVGPAPKRYVVVGRLLSN